MIPITPFLAIDEREIEERFVRSSGPGGQNVNKVSTAVELRFDVRRSSSLPPHVRERLEHIAGKRMSTGGILVIDAQRFRSQPQNRADALMRLVSLVREAARQPRRRTKTSPTFGSRKRRAETKRRQSMKKSSRRCESFPD
jgi:ribosome-associated protein